MSLPTFTTTIREIDPDWKGVWVEGNPCAINTDTMYKKFKVKVEVVQLNLNTGGMRVRYEWPSKRTKKGYEVKSCDISINEFFKHYEIKELV